MKRCDHCGAAFEYKPDCPWSRFCSRNCKDKAYSTAEPDGTIKDYWLRIDPDLRPLLPDGRLGRPQKISGLNAVASTFGLRGKEYAPVAQS